MQMTGLQSSTALHQWYGPGPSAQFDSVLLKGGHSDISEQAFQNVAALFFPQIASTEKSNRGSGWQTIPSDSIHSVREAVIKSMTLYEDSRKHTTVRKWLKKTAESLSFYSNVMDMLVQHHPEYVSLAWGAMKALIVAVVNHEKVVTVLAKALCDIGASLPRVELATNLYPTEMMSAAVEQLYAYILTFFRRAHEWYNESTLSHVIHSITRPAELRYADILESIADCSRKVDQLAVTGSQAELRHMHTKLNIILSRLDNADTVVHELMNQMTASQSLNYNATLDTNQRLSDLQFSQIMSHLSNNSFQIPNDRTGPQKPSQKGLVRYNGGKSIATARFWLKVENWCLNTESAIFLLRCSYRQRASMKDLVLKVHGIVQDARFITIQALDKTYSTSNEQHKTSVDILKYLILQVLSSEATGETEKNMAMTCRQFHCATKESDWFKLFEQVVSRITRPMFVFVDTCLLESSSTEKSGFSWIESFLAYLQNLRQRGFGTNLKVLILSWSSEPLPDISNEHKVRISMVTSNSLDRSSKIAHNVKQGMAIRRQQKTAKSILSVPTARA